jgi:hypothetical protein
MHQHHGRCQHAQGPSTTALQGCVQIAAFTAVLLPTTAALIYTSSRGRWRNQLLTVQRQMMACVTPLTGARQRLLLMHGLLPQHMAWEVALAAGALPCLVL